MKPDGLQRFCLTSDLKDDPALIDEYRRMHAAGNVWPEIPQGIRDVGILDMEIYLQGTRMVMIIEAAEGFDLEEGLERLSNLPRHRAWEEMMSKFQDTTATTSVVEKWISMEKIFKLA